VRDVRILAGFAVVYALTVVAFFVFARYRIQLVPALVPLAVHGVEAGAALVRDRRHPFRDVTAFVTAYLLAHLTIEPFSTTNVQIAALRLHKLADVRLLAGDADGAIDALTEAMAVCPDRCPGELDALVRQMVARGRTASAIALLHRLVDGHPERRAAAAELDRLTSPR
jgi:hypothetical protein